METQITAGTRRLGGITRAGNECLRALLVTSAMAVIRHADRCMGFPSAHPAGRSQPIEGRCVNVLAIVWWQHHKEGFSQIRAQMRAEHADAARLNGLSGQVIGCAFTVMNALGVGFLEKVYENGLAHELRKSGLKVAQQHAWRSCMMASNSANMLSTFWSRTHCWSN